MTPLLEFRAPRAEDAAALTALMNLPGVRAGTRRLPFTGEDWVRERLAPHPNLYAIVGVLDGEPVAWASLVRRTGRAAHSGELSMSVHDAYWGRGIGRAALGALVDLADHWLGLTRLQLEVLADNGRAVRLYEAAGFEREGTLRGAALCAGALIDSHVMGRLRAAPRRAGAEAGT